MTSIVGVLCNAQVKTLKHDGNISTFRNAMLYFIFQKNKDTEVLLKERTIIIVVLLQAADLSDIRYDIFK